MVLCVGWPAHMLCIAKELGTVSKQALEHFIVVNLAVIFPQINRSGGSRGFVAGRIKLHLYAQCKVSAPLLRRSIAVVCLCADWRW